MVFLKYILIFLESDISFFQDTGWFFFFLCAPSFISFVLEKFIHHPPPLKKRPLQFSNICMWFSGQDWKIGNIWWIWRVVYDAGKFLLHLCIWLQTDWPFSKACFFLTLGFQGPRCCSLFCFLLFLFLFLSHSYSPLVLGQPFCIMLFNNKVSDVVSESSFYQSK